MQTVAILAAVLAVVFLLRALVVRRESVAATSASPAPANPTEDSVRVLLLRGRKIEAIKAYRRVHNVDLRDAKRAVDQLAEQLAPRC